MTQFEDNRYIIIIIIIMHILIFIYFLINTQFSHPHLLFHSFIDITEDCTIIIIIIVLFYLLIYLLVNT